MLEQSLFGEIALPPSEVREVKRAERLRKAKLCYSKTSEAWKTATYNFAVAKFLGIIYLTPSHKSAIF